MCVLVVDVAEVAETPARAIARIRAMEPGQGNAQRRWSDLHGGLKYGWQVERLETMLHRDQKEGHGRQQGGVQALCLREVGASARLQCGRLGDWAKVITGRAFKHLSQPSVSLYF